MKAFFTFGLLLTPNAHAASSRELAVRLFDRLATYISPTDPRLQTMTDLIAQGKYKEAAQVATADKRFAQDTLFRFYAPLCNRNRDKNSSLNDCILTGIGITWNESSSTLNYDFRSVLTGNVIYDSSLTSVTPTGGAAITIPPRNPANNLHYDALYDNRNLIFWVDSLRANVQRTNYTDAAGLLTTDQFLREHAVAGTNRRVVQYALEEFILFGSIQRMRDTNIPGDRIRQDVPRAPGGNPASFQAECRTCHSWLDPMTSAFNRYDVNANGVPVYLTTVAPKLTQSGATAMPPREFADNLGVPGYKESGNAPMDGFEIRALSGPNSWIDWDSSRRTGVGAKDFGAAVSSSYGFQLAAVKRVWELVCMRAPKESEMPEVESMARYFKTVLNYKLTRLIEEVAVLEECLGR